MRWWVLPPPPPVETGLGGDWAGWWVLPPIPPHPPGTEVSQASVQPGRAQTVLTFLHAWQRHRTTSHDVTFYEIQSLVPINSAVGAPLCLVEDGRAAFFTPQQRCVVCPRKTGACQLITLLTVKVQEDVLRRPVRQAAACGGYTVLPFTEQSVQKTLSKAPQSWVSVTQCITLHQIVCVKRQQTDIFKHERSHRTAPRSNDRKPATNRATQRQWLTSASPGCSVITGNENAT